MVRHLPANPVDGVQRCQWCGAVLIDWSGDGEVTVIAGDEQPDLFYFAADVEVVHEGPFMGTNRHHKTGELIDTESPTCREGTDGYR